MDHKNGHLNPMTTSSVNNNKNDDGSQDIGVQWNLQCLVDIEMPAGWNFIKSFFPFLQQQPFKSLQIFLLDHALAQLLLIMLCSEIYDVYDATL